MVSGGLGGIGRFIIGWMVVRDVRVFLVLSISGARSQPAEEFLSKMEKKAVRLVAPPCDISSEGPVIEIMEYYTQSMPPIKGCI